MNPAVIAAAIAVLFLVAWSRANATALQVAADQFPPQPQADPAPQLTLSEQIADGVSSSLDQIIQAITPETEPPDVIAANRAAFLAMLSHSEGTDRGGDPYRVLFGGQQWSGSLDSHPAAQGWPGLPLPDAQCRAAGFGPGCVSTAAGRYQITRTTWRTLSSIGTGFDADTQDAMALELIRRRGALADVDAGHFDAAVSKCRREWASLPGAGYAQPERSMDALRIAYVNAGGTVA